MSNTELKNHSGKKPTSIITKKKMMDSFYSHTQKKLIPKQSYCHIFVN